MAVFEVTFEKQTYKDEKLACKLLELARSYGNIFNDIKITSNEKIFVTHRKLCTILYSLMGFFKLTNFRKLVACFNKILLLILLLRGISITAIKINV